VKTSWKRFIVFCLTLGVAGAPQEGGLTPAVTRALAHISADSLCGNLSFLASGLLEGRGTPSRGLDIAAAFIASQFRAAGLAPAGDDGYFETAHMLRVSPEAASANLRTEPDLDLAADDVTILSEHPVEINGARVVKVSDVSGVRGAEVKGRIVWLAGRRKDRKAIAQTVAPLEPAAFLEARDEEFSVPPLIDASEQQQIYGGAPRVIVRDNGLLDRLSRATLWLTLEAPTLIPFTVHNVIGVLPGSDAQLGRQYILITAHYDHLGISKQGTLYPGANDDGSGTVSVIEIAKALSALHPHPRRSIVFMTFFGEEEGGLGSLYYARHPVFALAQTVADLNLEQVGRTDSSTGPQMSNASLTGFDYSNITGTLERAGALTGIRVYRTPGEEEYYLRSDNATFAEHGIPAHTIVVAFDYSDYHASGDIWQKIDYSNMAKVDRMVALAAVMLADDAAAPVWNLSNHEAARFARQR
jgi:Peptidase family M28